MLMALLCAFITEPFSQTIVGRQKVDQYPTTSYGTKTYGLTWLPTDYNSTTTSYPLIIFLHGSGECGDGISGLNRLISTGLPKIIADGFNPEAKNPVNGQTYKFIVVSPQAPGSSRWSYSYSHVKNILEDVKKRYRIDVNRIYITGLSAGGAGTWSSVTNDPTFTQSIAAVTPVSSVGVNNPGVEKPNIPLINGKYGVKVWAICGADDSFYGKDGDYINLINNAAIKPTVPSIRTGIPNAGHSGAAWNTAYSPNWRTNDHKLNMFEWLLQYSRGFATPPPPPPVNQPPVVNAGTDKSLLLPLNSVSLTGSATDADGTIASYSWTKVSGPLNIFSSTTSSSTTVSNLVAGTYVFRLTVVDNSGNTTYDDVNVVVSASIAKPPSSTKDINVYLFNLSTSFVNTEWNGWNINNRKSNITSGALKYADGTASSVTALLTQSESVALNNYTQSGMAPVEVLKSTSYSGLGRSLIISGLSTSKTYTISLYASRSANSSNTTNFTINSSEVTINTYNNIDNKAVFTGIKSNSSGVIEIKIFKSGTFSYLNGFTLSEEATVTASAQQMSATEITNITQKASAVQIFPNPVQDKFVLKVMNDLKGNVSVNIYDVQGILKKEFSLTKAQSSTMQTYLSIGDLAPGTYTIQTSIGSWSESVQLIKL